VDHAGETADEGGNDVDPEIVVDGTFLHVDGERGDEKSDDDLQNFVIHFFLSFGLELDFLNLIIRQGMGIDHKVTRSSGPPQILKTSAKKNRGIPE